MLKPKIKSIIALPNIASMINSIGVITVLCVLPLGKHSIEFTVLGVIFTAYMAWISQIIIIWRGNVNSIYPFRLKRSVIKVEEISSIETVAKEYKLRGRGVTAIKTQYICANIKSTSGTTITFSQHGISLFNKVICALPLSTISWKVYNDNCKIEASRNFLRFGSLLLWINEMVLLFLLYNFSSINHIIIYGIGILLTLRPIIRYVKYLKLIDIKMIVKQRAKSGLDIIIGLVLTIIATVILIVIFKFFAD